METERSTWHRCSAFVVGVRRGAGDAGGGKPRPYGKAGRDLGESAVARDMASVAARTGKEQK